MPKISFESNFIRIELTQAEAANSGLGLNRSQLFRKSRSASGGVVLELFSIDSTKTSDSEQASVWIPPAQTFHVSSDSPERGTTRPVGPPTSSRLAERTPGSEKPSSDSPGWDGFWSVPPTLSAASGADGGPTSTPESVPSSATE